jgi:hypothetical protein
MPDLTQPSELMRLIDIEFAQVTPTRVSGSVAADERHHQPWGNRGVDAIRPPRPRTWPHARPTTSWAPRMAGGDSRGSIVVGDEPGPRRRDTQPQRR